jgi:diguanylate cyclase (GGDEF)-like protein
VGKPEFLSSLKYALALLICFPSAVLCDSITQYPHKRFSHIIGAVVAVLFVIESAGSFFFNVSLYRLFLISAILMIFNMIIAFHFTIREIRSKDFTKKRRFSIFVNISSILNYLVFILDLGVYAISSRHMTDWGRIARVYYVVFLFVVLIVLLRLAILRNKQAMLAEEYKVKSRTDALTGLLNKGAYIEKEAELTERLNKVRENGEKDFSFAIMAIDLNYLKKVNDNFGHDEGDRFIQSASDILRDAVGEHGETYRTGGDEFLAIIYGDDPEAVYQSVVKDLNDRIEKYNDSENKEIPLSLAYGHALCISSQNYSIHDSERIADKEMYECKRMMKAER